MLGERIQLPDLDDQSVQLPPQLRHRNLKSFESNFLLFGGRDSDGDGLTDSDEAKLGTDPQKRDTDGDGLHDGWEVHGVNGINLRALGASPLHKDIFVQMDYMERATASNGLGPDIAVIAGITAAYADAPVTNPDGKSGIAIHLIAGNKLGYVADLNPVEDAVAAFKKVSFDPKRAPVFHYMIWADTYDGGTSSGYSLTTPGSDFVVTLGAWHGRAGGTDAEKIGTFVHELGHNLGLRHGNFDDANYKPNHLSVMNYAFQTEGVKIEDVRRFTYQWLDLAALNENMLIEPNGVGVSLPGTSTIWFRSIDNRFVEASIGGALDWNQNGGTDSAAIATDLDGNLSEETLGATHAEWPVLVYNGGAIGQTSALKGLFSVPFQRAPASPKNELDFDLSQRLRDRVEVP